MLSTDRLTSRLLRYLARPAVTLTHNQTGNLSLPADMTFTPTSLMSVIVYGVLFVVAAGGNLMVFCTLYPGRYRRSRVSLYIMHLALADSIVACVVVPLEIVWHVTVSWNAGALLCRVFMFFRTFGFYVSSFILVVISVDRYFVFRRSVPLTQATRRGRGMVVTAWSLGAVASIPQSVIFHTETHPDFPWFTQCVTFNFFPDAAHELAYNLFTMSAMYLVPLIVIVVAYTLILCQMPWRSLENPKGGAPLELSDLSSVDRGPEDSAHGLLYRTGAVRLRPPAQPDTHTRIRRAKMRTLKMTIVIVSVFIVCWTPYVVMSTWWWFDKATAEEVHPTIQKCLFLFGVSNSCVNPIVYGMFSTEFRRGVKSFQRRLKLPQRGGWGG